MKKAYISSLRFASIVGTLGGLFADVLTPLLPFSSYLVWLCLILFAISSIYWNLKYRNKGDKTGKSQYDNFAFKTLLFAGFSLPFLSILYYLNGRANSNLGYVGSHVNFIGQVQVDLFNLKDDIKNVESKVDEANKTLSEIKEAIKGDSEIKNLSSTSDYSVVEKLNARTKNKGAKRLAIIYFTNTSEDRRLDKLSKGLASMMITDLSPLRMLVIVERERLEEVLKEQKLTRTKQFDPTTAARVGKLLGAELILTGNYFEMLGSLRIDSRIINVETGQILHASGVEGNSTDLFKLEKQMVWKLVKSLDLEMQDDEQKTLVASEEVEQIDLLTLETYSIALEEFDRNNYDSASALIKKVLNRNPSFVPAMILSADIEKRI